MPSPQPIPGRCGRKKPNGYCMQYPMKGTPPGKPYCRQCLPGGRGHTVEKVMHRAKVVMELEKWQLSTQPTDIDPDETILRLLSQSVARANLYAVKLHEAFTHGQKLQALLRAQADGEQLSDEDTASLQASRERLDWIFNTGGISALIGHTWSMNPKGQRYATGEEIRALARLEIEERKLAASFAKVASQRNIAQRQLDIAEAQGAALVAVVFASLRALGLDPDDLTVREIVTAQLAAVGSGQAAIASGPVAYVDGRTPPGGP